ncbi:MAG: potassium channel family protein [Candidatus ainarchaeum sp.]|nr:potassium channel family protein [Candidatus ainarchaeum sp.]
MDELRKRLFFSVLLVLIIYAVGVLLYENVEGWDWINSVYFMTATITTVGYGDVVPHTDIGKLMTVAFSWVGISIGFYLIYTISMYREAAFDPKLRGLMSKIRGEKEEKPDVSKYMRRADRK